MSKQQDQKEEEKIRLTEGIEVKVVVEDSTTSEPAVANIQPIEDETETRVVTAEMPQLIADRYEILSRIGEGGMGTVYKIRDHRLNKIFALKRLHSDALDSDNIKRFEQEANAAIDMTHANLVSVYEFGRDSDGAPYLVMDYVDGKSLSNLIDEHGKIEYRRAIGIFIQICDALSFAHLNGLVHRDIKPSNIILATHENGYDNVKIVDFGIAKVLFKEPGETARMTNSGEVIGSPSYMSPEQCQGEDLDERSDVYSLGCLMYEVLTGKPPFHSPNPMKVLIKQVTQQPSGFGVFRKQFNIPEALETLVLTCLKKSPKDRYQSMDKLRSDLLASLSDVRSKTPLYKLLWHSPKFNILLISLLLIGILIFTNISKDAFQHQANNEQDANTSRFYLNRAARRSTMGDSNGAISDYTRAIQLEPTKFSAYRDRGIVKCNNDNRGAINDFNKAIYLNPKDPLSYSSRGYVKNELKDHIGAIHDCDMAIHLSPTNYLAYANRGCAHEKLGNYEDALQDYSKAINLNPKKSFAYYNRGALRQKLNDNEGAIKDYSESIKLNLKTADAYYNRGLARKSLGDNKGAVSDINNSISYLQNTQKKQKE